MPRFRGTQHLPAVLLAMAGTLLAWIVLNRWAFTNLGTESFGRVWPFYISYTDFGFVRRALLGTLLTISKANSLFSNEYIAAIVLHHIAILTFTGVLLRFIIKAEIKDTVFVATIFLSPALVIQSGYSTGTLDIYVLLLVALNMLYVQKILIFCTTLVFGILLHELFIFTIPAQFLAYMLRVEGAGSIKQIWRLLGMSILSVAGAIIAIQYFGHVDMARPAYEAVMQNKLPNAAYKHGLWSGYFEVSADINEHRQSSKEIASALASKLYYIFLPLLYVALVIYRLMCLITGTRWKFLYAATTLLPLLVFTVAMDFYRWVGMSANMALLLSLVLVSLRKEALDTCPKWLAPVILSFALLAPFGSAALDRPFPMHQFLLEKLQEDGA